MTTRPPRAGDVIIGVDLGTTAVKVCAYPIEGALAGEQVASRVSAEREYPMLEPHPGWQVQSPHTMVTAAFAAIGEVVDQVGPARVAALSCSTAMHGLVGLDARMEPLTHLVTWADTRALAESQHLRASGQANDLHERSGTPVHPMSPLAKLMWFTRHEPALAARVRWWCGLKDYLLWCLSATTATELSSASATGLLDIHSGHWAPEHLRLAGISPSQLPEVLPTTAVLGLSGPSATRLGLPHGLPVVAGATDGPLGNLGVGALDPGVAGLSLGTSGALRSVVATPGIDAQHRLFCYALTHDQWVVGGAISNGGLVMRWLLTLLGQDLVSAPNPDELLVRLAETVPPGADGLSITPLLIGERAPLWDPTLSAGIVGLQHRHGRGHFVRAAMEGISFQIAAIAEALSEREPITRVRATGGAFRAPLWAHVMAGVLGLPVHPTAAADGSALGAAALGLLALGRATSLRDGLEQLNPGAFEDGDAVVADDAEVAGYRRIRHQVAERLRDQQRLIPLYETHCTPSTQFGNDNLS